MVDQVQGQKTRHRHTAMRRGLELGRERRIEIEAERNWRKQKRGGEKQPEKTDQGRNNWKTRNVIETVAIKTHPEGWEWIDASRRQGGVRRKLLSHWVLGHSVRNRSRLGSSHPHGSLQMSFSQGNGGALLSDAWYRTSTYVMARTGFSAIKGSEQTNWTECQVVMCC